MAKLVWDDKRPYEAGVSHGVFFPETGPGIPWNGLISVTEQPSDISASDRYYDGQKYKSRRKSDSFSGSIEALTYPEALEESVGESPRSRRPFGLSYRTQKNDADAVIHVVYNVLLSVAERGYASVGDASDPLTFSWDFTTRPVAAPGAKPTAHFAVDTTLASAEAIDAFENVLYGSPTTIPRLPSISEVISLFESFVALRIVDNGDGTWTATGPDNAFAMLDPDTFEITWPSALYIGADTYKISSL